MDLSLKQALEQAEKNKQALGHFNVSNLEGVWAVFEAAQELELPVVIGVSEGEREFMGVKQIAAIVKSLRSEFDYPVFLNADHTYSVAKVVAAAQAGFDAVIFDAAGESLVENIEMTKEATEAVKAINPEIIVEAEMGYIGKSSKVMDEVPTGAIVDEVMMTDPDEAKKFVEETGVDCLAPAVGNIHGMIKSGNPRLNIQRIKNIREIAGVPLVLHGGSGISDEDFKAAIIAGIGMVHISTELRVAYREGLEQSLTENPTEVAPYRLLKPAREAVKEVVKNRLKLFSNLG
ncbi:MAG: class II fructose-bisphosphate aldolase [Patescibacteria group bacterium]